MFDYNLGTHCKICKQRDYLPFTCSDCSGAFCLAHRSHDAHNCPSAAAKAAVTVVPICPLCASPVPKTTPTEDANNAVSRHIEQHCIKNPHRTVQKVKTERCRISQCKNKILTTCKNCAKTYCLDHRHEHKCVKVSIPHTPAVPLTGQLHKERAVRLIANEIPKAYTSMHHSLDMKKMFAKKRQSTEQLQFTNTAGTAICPLHKPNLPSEERFVFKLLFPVAESMNPCHVYVPDSWLAGRLVDVVSEKAQLESRSTYKLFLLASSAKNAQPLRALPNNKSLQDLAKEGFVQQHDWLLVEKVSSDEQEILDVQTVEHLVSLIVAQQKHDSSLLVLKNTLLSCKKQLQKSPSSPRRKSLSVLS